MRSGVVGSLVAVCLGLAAPDVAASQSDAGTPIERGRSFQLPSRVLGETRVIDVTLPDGYATEAGRRYPVLVVLDGESEQEPAATVARFYATMSQLPPLIVVGVRNTDRARDLTTAPAAGFRVPPEVRAAGGADKFLAFVSDELIPWIDRSYRTAPMRVLVGHSLGGLFALYTLGQRPDLFTGYVVMEPAAWWNNGREFQAAQAMLQQPAARRARVMMVNTAPLGLDTTRWGGASPMIRHIAVTGETHASMALGGMIAGLRTMFADFRPTSWQPGTRPIAMLERYDSLAARIGYAAPIPADAYSTVVRMSLDSRLFDDAARVLDRMERNAGSSDETRQFRDRLTRERAAPAPAGFVPLEFPARRPTALEAAAFVGSWVSVAPADSHEVTIRVSGDTIVVHDRLQFGNGDWFEADDPVIQVAAAGTLEWGLPFFRGIAGLLVLQGRVLPDGTMTVTREVRGWVPRGPAGDMLKTEHFRRAR